MERLTKKELRALLEFIKECYLICDLETFSQRVVSRISKIVPTEFISYNGINPRRRRKVCAPYPHAPYIPSQKKIFKPRVGEHPVVIQNGKIRDNPHGQFDRPGLYNKFYRRLGEKYRLAPRLIREGAVNCRAKNLALHDKLIFKLLTPHLSQAYRNAQTITDMQQKLTMVDRALYRMNLGLIFLAPNGKIRLATTGAMQQLTSYLGLQCLRENRLPESLWRWVKQQEIGLKGNDDVLAQRNPLVLTREGKRLVIRLVSDLDQSLLLLEEHPTTMQVQSLVPFGLSAREAQVLDWVAQGKTNKEIGVILELSHRTVQKHLEHIYRKIYVETRTAAAVKAYEMASRASKPTAMFFIVVGSLLIT